mmetsp:Transcript_5418/g.16140  ORF Transcript_5418/g.16140 Transcript_5418/m.16140 type:complete len:155 (-) Transcript_5418:145-609(-)
MAKSAITLAAPPADEAADALLSTKKLIKPKKSGSIKGILVGAALVSFALGLLAAVTPSMRQALFGGDQWSLTVAGGLGSKREFPLHSVDPNYVSFVVDPASLEVIPTLFSSASSIKIFACSARHDTCAKPAVPRHAHPRTRPSFVFQWRACVQM